jgi:hypothetical protein
MISKNLKNREINTKYVDNAIKILTEIPIEKKGGLEIGRSELSTGIQMRKW